MVSWAWSRGRGLGYFQRGQRRLPLGGSKLSSFTIGDRRLGRYREVGSFSEGLLREVSLYITRESHYTSKNRCSCSISGRVKVGECCHFHLLHNLNYVDLGVICLLSNLHS